MIYKRIIRPFVAVAILVVTLIACNNDDSGSGESGTNQNLENRQPLGASANELLSSDEFRSIRVEIAYAEGLRPDQRTIDSIQTFLEARLDKPDGVTIVENLIPNPSQLPPYDINEIVEIEDEFRTVFNNGDEIGVWLFFSDEESASNVGNSVVLGSAYRNTSMVVYESTFIEFINSSTLPINRFLLETTTLRHEFGHILGLVNSGTPLTSPHEDEQNERHCNVLGCLMFFQTVTDVFTNPDFTAVPAFDPLCIADLQANGGL